MIELTDNVRSRACPFSDLDLNVHLLVITELSGDLELLLCSCRCLDGSVERRRTLVQPDLLHGENSQAIFLCISTCLVLEVPRNAVERTVQWIRRKSWI